MTPKRLGTALYDMGWYATGGILFFLLMCGGGHLWSNNVADNPFLTALAWGLILALGGGLLSVAVGYVLQEASDEPTADADLASRVKNLEAEVARLRKLLALPPDPLEPAPSRSGGTIQEPGDVHVKEAFKPGGESASSRG